MLRESEDPTPSQTEEETLLMIEEDTQLMGSMVQDLLSLLIGYQGCIRIH